MNRRRWSCFSAPSATSRRLSSPSKTTPLKVAKRSLTPELSAFSNCWKTTRVVIKYVQPSRLFFLTLNVCMPWRLNSTFHTPRAWKSAPGLTPQHQDFVPLICRMGEVCATDASADEQPRRLTAAAAHGPQRRERPQALQAGWGMKTHLWSASGTFTAPYRASN